LPKFWQNVNVVRFHCQSDDVEKSSEKLEGDLGLYKIVQIMVNEKWTQGKKLYDAGKENAGKQLMAYYIYIDNMGKKAMGAFTREEFKNAVYRYIDTKPSVLKSLKQVSDGSGRTLYNHSNAREKLATDLFERHYGNQQ
jgi:hypothetical protein